MNSFETFKDMPLDGNTKTALNEIGFEKPTEVQEKSIIPSLEGRDVVVQARTGSGKTHSFLLPVFEKIEGDCGLEAIVLTPTRELAQQVKNEASKIGKHHNINTLAVYGGASISFQINNLPKTSVVAGTPGRVMDLMRRGELKLENLKFFILDEADRMLDMGFLDDIKWIISKTNREKQVMLYSATMPDEIVTLSKKYTNNPVKLILSKDDISAKGVSQYYVSVGRRNKLAVLSALLDNEKGKYLIFSNTKKWTRILSDKLRKYRYKAHEMHGDMSQSARTKTMNKFKAGKIDILVSTDVASRGIDVENITHVVNYDVPKYEKDYVHRIGRTGRMGKEGKAITFVTRDEMEFLEGIEEFIDNTIERLEVEGEGRVKRKTDYSHHSDIFGMVTFEFTLDHETRKWDLIKKIQKYGIREDEVGKISLDEYTGELQVIEDKASRVTEMNFFENIELIEKNPRER